MTWEPARTTREGVRASRRVPGLWPGKAIVPVPTRRVRAETREGSMAKVRRAEWEIVFVSEPGDRWPIMNHPDGLDMDPQEVNVGFDAIEAGPAVLLPVEVSGPLVYEGRAVGSAGALEVSVRLLPDWLQEIVALAVKALGVGDYTTEGENHDRRRGLRSVQ